MSLGIFSVAPPTEPCALGSTQPLKMSRARAEPDGSPAETRYRLSPKRTSPFKSAGESVQSTAGSRGVRINVSNAGYTTLRGRVRVLATHSLRQFPLHFPSRASPCAIIFRTQYTNDWNGEVLVWPSSVTWVCGKSENGKEIRSLWSVNKSNS